MHFLFIWATLKKIRLLKVENIGVNFQYQQLCLWDLAFITMLSQTFCSALKQYSAALNWNLDFCCVNAEETLILSKIRSALAVTHWLPWKCILTLWLAHTACLWLAAGYWSSMTTQTSWSWLVCVRSDSQSTSSWSWFLVCGASLTFCCFVVGQC